MTEPELTLTWEDPPQRVGRTGKYPHAKWAEELRARPNTWAKVLESSKVSNAQNLALVIRNGLCKPYLPKGSFQAVSRGLAVFARYLPPVVE